MGTGIKGDNAAVAVVGSGSHTAHMRPDESKQVLLQLHFEFRWIVGSCVYLQARIFLIFAEHFPS